MGVGGKRNPLKRQRTKRSKAPITNTAVGINDTRKYVLKFKASLSAIEGSKMLDADLAAVGCGPVEVSCELAAVRCELVDICCGIVAVFCELVAVSCELVAVCCEIVAVFCELVAICCELVSHASSYFPDFASFAK